MNDLVAIEIEKHVRRLTDAFERSLHGNAIDADDASAKIEIEDDRSLPGPEPRVGRG